MNDTDYELIKKYGSINTNEGTGNNIPSFLREKPFFFKDYKTDDELAHLKEPEFTKQVKTPINHTSRLNVKKRVIIYKKGCCKNCGSPDHTELDCMEKPKKINAMVSGVGVYTETTNNDNHNQLSYDAKRDYFGTLTPEHHRLLVTKKFNYNEQKMAESGGSNPRKSNMNITHGSTSSRIRQDVPGFIKALNLNANETYEPDDDKFVKADQYKIDGMYLGQFIHEVDPEIKKAMRKVKEEKDDVEENEKEFQQRKQLLEQNMKTLDYVKEKLPPSIYPESLSENIFGENHTEVWGSYYSNGKWGYACCKQTDRSAPCLNFTEKRSAIS